MNFLNRQVRSEDARAVVLRSGWIVVHCPWVSAARIVHCTCSSKRVDSEVGPIVLEIDDPLGIDFVRTCAGCPVATVTRRHPRLTHQRRVLGCIQDAGYCKTRPRISSQITDDVHHRRVATRNVGKNVSVVPVAEVGVRHVRHSQNRGVGRGVCHDECSTWSHLRARREVEGPEIHVARDGRCRAQSVTPVAAVSERVFVQENGR